MGDRSEHTLVAHPYCHPQRAQLLTAYVRPHLTPPKFTVASEPSHMLFPLPQHLPSFAFLPDLSCSIRGFADP